MNISLRSFLVIPFIISTSCLDWLMPDEETPPRPPRDTTIYSIETASGLPIEKRHLALEENRVQDDIEFLEAFMDTTVIWWDGIPDTWSHVSKENAKYLKPDDRLLKAKSQLMGAEYEIGPYIAGLRSFQEELFEAFRRSPYAPTLEDMPDDKVGFERLFTFWFGVKLFKYPEEGELFSQVDPEAIKQLSGLLPKASSSWQGTTYGEAYKSWFRHPTRSLALSYAYILSKGIEEETQAYMYMAKRETTEGDRNAMDYLFGKYNEALAEEWNIYEEEYDYQFRYSFSPPHAIGFWLRRHADGSDKALWNAMVGILNEYDPDWIIELQKKYPEVQGIWKNPQQMTSTKSIFIPENRSYLKIDNIAVFFETVVDDYKITGFADQLVLPTGKHDITILNCLEEESKGFCDCQHFELNQEAKKQTTIKYSHENTKQCSPDGKPLPEKK